MKSRKFLRQPFPGGWLAIGILFCSMFLSGLVFSHEARPILFDIQELAPESGLTDANAPFKSRYQVRWKIPPTVPANGIPSLVLPEHCQKLPNALRQRTTNSYQGSLFYHCDDGLSGHSLTLSYPTINPSVSTLFRLGLNNGEKHARVLKPGENVWTVPAAENFLGVARDYMQLGIVHIWKGLDHLLFVACLIYIAGSMKRILITITGFTLAHSITLALSVLGWVRVPVPPVEAVIALSIVFLAHEIAVNNRQSWTFRYPVSVSTSFGFLHGFGFAAVLKDLGLPQTELGTALLFFNVGVEIGQILFIAALLLLFLAGAKLLRPLRQGTFAPGLMQGAVSCCIGVSASFWLVERISAFWS